MPRTLRNVQNTRVCFHISVHVVILYILTVGGSCFFFVLSLYWFLHDGHVFSGSTSRSSGYHCARLPLCRSRASSNGCFMSSFDDVVESSLITAKPRSSVP